MTPQFDNPTGPMLQLLMGHFREGPAYQTRRERGTDDWLLILTLQGAGRFGTGSNSEGGAIRALPGEVVLIRPGTRHDYATAPDPGHWELLWAHFQPRLEWHEWLAWPEAAPGLMHMPLQEPILQKITARFLEAHRLATGALKQRNAFALNALEEVLLWCETQNPRSEQGRMDTRVRDCLEYLCQNLAEKVTLEQLAALCHLSMSRLAHLFREQVGLTPQQFQEQQRLLRARQLLELSGHSIGEIAAEVGFDNPFYFTLRFKRFTGQCPRDYRKSSRTMVPSDEPN